MSEHTKVKQIEDAEKWRTIAPELLEALEDVKARIQVLVEDGIYWVDDPSLCGFDSERIDAAIAKARGES